MKAINLTKNIKAWNELERALNRATYAQQHERIYSETEMKKIKSDLAIAKETVSLTNQKLTEELDIIQKRCKERTITTIDIIQAVKILEEYFPDNMPKKYLEGIAVDIDINHQSFPKAYKYTPQSTIITIQRISNKWYLTEIERNTCTNHLYRWIQIPEGIKGAIVNAYFV